MQLFVTMWVILRLPMCRDFSEQRRCRGNYAPGSFFSGLVHQGGQLEIYSNYKSPSKNYSNIEAYVYLNDKYLGEAEMLPYTPPGPDGVDAGQNIYFEFSARALGEQELTVVVINGSETESVSSPLTVTPSPVTDDEEFIKLLFTGLYSRSPEPYELSENLQLLQDRIYTWEQIIERYVLILSLPKPEISYLPTKP